MSPSRRTETLAMTRVPAMRTLENALRSVGFVHVAGVDEVGRGCLAGPVVAAAVVLHPDRHVPGVCDSKAVQAPERERLYEKILAAAVAWAVAAADPAEIDRINIHQASLRAMQRAVLALAPLPDIVLVDAFRVPDLPMAQRGVLHGDRRCSAIAAASIVAKVTRDRQMLDLHSRDPRYGFDRHKGYATADHLDAVARFGYSDVHRRSFRPPTLFDTMDGGRPTADHQLTAEHSRLTTEGLPTED
jgi:ribonuclease HII